MAQNVSVILARDVPNLGKVGELVNVRPGYARNYLVPQGLALPASTKRVALFQHQQRIVEHKRRVLRAASEKRAKEIEGLQVTITAKVGEQNKLFGSITSRDVAKALADVGQSIHHRDIKLAEPLKTIGIHTVEVRLEADVTTQVKVIVAAEVEAAPSGEAEGDEEGEAEGAEAAATPDAPPTA